MLTRRSLLGGVAAGWLASAAGAAPGDKPLRQKAAARGRFYGCAAGSYQLRDEDFAECLSGNMLSPMNRL